MAKHCRRTAPVYVVRSCKKLDASVLSLLSLVVVSESETNKMWSSSHSHQPGPLRQVAVLQETHITHQLLALLLLGCRSPPH